MDQSGNFEPIKLVKKQASRFIRSQNADPVISTDRNSVTPHPNAVPFGYIQMESGATLEQFHRGGDVILPETVLRMGAWPTGELRFQVPNYFRSSGTPGRIEGVSDIQIGIKQELEPGFIRKSGVDVGVIAGLTLPTGSRVLTTSAVDPFVQVISFYRRKNHTLGTSHSIFLPSVLPDDDLLSAGGSRNVTYQPTAILFKHLKVGKAKEEKADIWIEYAGLFPQRGLSLQVIDMGGVYRPVKRHQVDFRFGFGLSSRAPRAFIGFGYSWLPGRLLPR